LPLQWWEAELRRLGVTIRLGERIDPTAPPVADRVVWAVGSSPAQTAVWRLRPYLFDGLPGASRALQGRDVMAGRASVAGQVAVVDEEGGWAAISLVSWLLAAPTVSAVTVFTTEAAFGESTVSISFEGGALRPIREAEAAGRVKFIAKSRVEAIEFPVLMLPGSACAGPFDAIVLSTGTAANAYPEDATAVGDCVAPRGLWSATSDAARLVTGWVD
jgi:hypothetical protein